MIQQRQTDGWYLVRWEDPRLLEEGQILMEFPSLEEARDVWPTPERVQLDNGDAEGWIAADILSYQEIVNGALYRCLFRWEQLQWELLVGALASGVIAGGI